jgi:hypothetical protein
MTSRESAFLAARNGHFAPTPKEKISQSREELAEDSPTCLASDDRLAGEVKRVLEQGQHAPVALRHYLAGRIGLDEVARFVSQDLADSEVSAGGLIPAVRAALENFAAVEEMIS